MKLSHNLILKSTETSRGLVHDIKSYKESKIPTVLNYTTIVGGFLFMLFYCDSISYTRPLFYLLNYY